jgi:hypothetical protein
MPKSDIESLQQQRAQMIEQTKNRKQKARLALYDLLREAFNGLETEDIYRLLKKSGHTEDDVLSALLLCHKYGEIEIDHDTRITLVHRKNQLETICYPEPFSAAVTRLAHPLR